MIVGVTTGPVPRPAPRARKPDSERPRRRPVRLGPVRLRQHDLQLRGRVVRHGPVARRGHAVREANGPFAFSVAIAVSVGINALVSPILGALSDRAGGRRLPYLLFFTLLCIVPTALIGQSPAVRRPASSSSIANFAYQSALIYYDATLKTVSYPETRGKLSGIGVGDRLLRDDLHRASDLPARPADRERFFVAAALFGLFAIPLFLVVREPVRRPARRSRASARRSPRSGSCGRRSLTPGRCRAWPASWSAGSSTPTRSTRSSS